MVRLSIGTALGSPLAVLEWATANLASVAGFLSRGPHRPSADADELRRRCQANHSPGRGRRRGGGAAGAYYGSNCVQVVDAYGRVVTRR